MKQARARILGGRLRTFRDYNVGCTKWPNPMNHLTRLIPATETRMRAAGGRLQVSTRAGVWRGMVLSAPKGLIRRSSTITSDADREIRKEVQRLREAVIAPKLPWIHLVVYEGHPK